MKAVTNTFKEGLTFYYTNVSKKLLQDSNDHFSMSGFDPRFPLSSDQDVSKHLGLEEDEEAMRGDRRLHQGGRSQLSSHERGVGSPMSINPPSSLSLPLLFSLSSGY